MSTRGLAPVLGFEEVLLAGLPRDGGLYVPESLPRLAAHEIEALAGLPYAEAAGRVMRPFIGDEIPEVELQEILNKAYARFEHEAVAPLVQVDAYLWLLELFHGPTLAFKDIAMQVLGPLMDRALKRRRMRTTILAATSGDTGSAAIEAFRGRDNADIFILHPYGRVSDVQRRQMTTASESNVHNIAIEGTFDDCQALVKAMFNDRRLHNRLSLSAVNSINWARIVAQIVYYFTAAVALGAPARAVSFAVPTGNFGDIFAGHVARAMGLPVERLVIATNLNDILARTVAAGRYQPRDVRPTSSPSMDIQVSSNFERLLFDVTGRDGARVRALMSELSAKGAFELSAREHAALQDGFVAERVEEDEVAATIRSLYHDSDYLADPHTAVGIAAARRHIAEGSAPMIALATAHPAKFPQAVEKACGMKPEAPERLKKALGGKECFAVLRNDLSQVADFIANNSRAVAEVAR